MKVKKVVKSSLDNCGHCCDKDPKAEAIRHVKKAMHCLALVENSDDVCCESIANLGVVLADLSDDSVDLGMEVADVPEVTQVLPNGDAPTLGPVED